jgi:hypothetical protein
MVSAKKNVNRASNNSYKETKARDAKNSIKTILIYFFSNDLKNGGIQTP